MKNTSVTHPSRLTLAGVLASAALLGLMLPAQAININFNADQGYSLTGGTYANGGLTGQPATGGATKWTSTASNAGQETYRVAANSISGSGQMLATTANGNTSFYSFTASDSDLGGAFDASASKLSFSMDVAWLERKGSSTTVIQRISFGDYNSPIFQLELLAGGNILFKAGSATYWSTSRVADATSGYVAGTTYNVGSNTNSWVNISGVIDYENDTFTLFINGVQQQVLGSTSIAMIPGSTQSQAINLRQLNGTNAEYVPMAIDNVNLALVPEPRVSALALTGVVGASLLVLRRRRAAACKRSA